ncbi:uncharacterized protein MONOS_12444 [Monocercomonoides exilis]|uniref:uncharacterized protein n=1 Tax=Monocercomonoides exilis TaxID=2049356 RepID=UPI00355AB9C7|nr:hypothetical protein MONOS_12444 [Monocercomonoides exilis]|eukprot:MONOS_12444.1-p1 / transcript=MONOS_12444.1 / gene=MONOS_12444 / organism=Monocercomonoides_exilis_PA203 / gene_product=unspecified product / transcript_product=unspecified product / location=Mono_scaffold00690:15217-15720(-) / protein_length=168 / sequence_SO=supercontig / SO=protein_coding / is_pseudo=false
MDGGWRGVGGRALIAYSQEMEMGRGAVGTPTTPLSPVVVGEGGEVVMLAVMGMKDLNKEMAKAMQDEFHNEKGKVYDEEAKIIFGSLESDDQREKLLRLMKQQEIQKKRNEKEEKERRRKKKKTKICKEESKEYCNLTLRQARQPTRRRTKWQVRRKKRRKKAKRQF